MIRPRAPVPSGSEGSGLGLRGLLALMFGIVAGCAPQGGTQGRTGYTGADTTVDSAGTMRITARSERYLLAHNTDAAGMHPFVIRERSTSTCCFAEEHETHSAFTLERILVGSDSVLWKTAAPFDRGAIEGEFYRGVEEGCCDAPDRSTFISLATGAIAFTLTPQLDHDWDTPVEIDIPNTRLQRFVTFDERADLIAPKDTARPRLFGVLQYGDGLHPSRRYAIRATALPAAPKLRSLRVRADSDAAPGEFRMDLWAANGRVDPHVISGARILLGVTDVSSGRDVSFEFPVAADSLDLRHARVPNGWSITLMR